MKITEEMLLAAIEKQNKRFFRIGHWQSPYVDEEIIVITPELAEKLCLTPMWNGSLEVQSPNTVSTPTGYKLLGEMNVAIEPKYKIRWTRPGYEDRGHWINVSVLREGGPLVLCEEEATAKALGGIILKDRAPYRTLCFVNAEKLEDAENEISF